MNRLRTKHSPVSFAEQSVSKERKRELYPIAERNGKVMSPKNGKTNSGQSYAGIEAGTERSRPILHQKPREIQAYNKIAKLPIGLDEEVCADSVENLNQLLADTITLRDMYKKHHWQVGGPTIAMAHDVAETTMIPRPPRGREEAPVQISRLLEAHELILKEAHTIAKQADDAGDDGTNDLVVSEVIRTNELQVWFLAEHLVDVPLVKADDAGKPEPVKAKAASAKA